MREFAKKVSADPTIYTSFTGKEKFEGKKITGVKIAGLTSSWESRATSNSFLISE